MKNIIISLLILLSLSTTLFANIGKITAVKGDATLKRGLTNIPIKVGFIIEKNDHIFTKSNARVQVVFKDKTIISLGKNTSFSINDYFYDEAQPKKVTAKFKVAKGIFKAITGRIGKINPNKFKLHTKSASIGIRGTVFFAKVTKGGDEISCTQGKIIVQTPQGVVEVKAGEVTKVEVGQPPVAPAPLSKNQQGALEKDSGAKDNEKESGANYDTANEKPKPKTKKVVKEKESKDNKAQPKENKTKSVVKQDDSKGDNTPPPSPNNEGNPPPSPIAPSPTADPLVPATAPLVFTAPAPDPVLNPKIDPKIDPTPPAQDPTPSYKTADYTALHTSNIRTETSSTDSFINYTNNNYKITNGVVTSTSNGIVSLPIDMRSKPYQTTYDGYIKINDIYSPGSTTNIIGGVFADKSWEFFIRGTRTETDDGSSITESTNMEVFGEKTLFSKISGLTGISKYTEPTLDSSSDDNIYGTSGVKINWTNKMVLRYVFDTRSSSVLIGKVVDENGYAKLSFNTFTKGIQDMDSSSSVNNNIGYLFGNNYQGFGVTVKEHTNTSSTISNVSTHGAFRDTSFNQASTEGSSILHGFTNNDASTITIDNIFKGLNGHINGEIGSGIGLNIGGYFNNLSSAYIDNDTFYASINESGNTIGSLIAVDLETTLGDDISWGTWATNDTELNQYWVATSLNIDTTAYDTGSPTANYTGQAMGTIDDGTFIDPRNSIINFTLDFSTNKINADLKLDGSTPWGIMGSTNLTLNNGKFSGGDTSNAIHGGLYSNGDVSIGSFEFTNDSDSSNIKVATGVYKATKQ